MEITYLGHACFQFSISGKKILFDPFISGNELAKNIQIDQIEADYILLSHGHQDHVLDVPAIAKRTSATIVSNYEIVSYYGAQGLSKGHPMNHGGSWQFDFGKVKYVNAVHSSVLPDGTYGGNPGGFVIESEEGNFYYSGDTALTYDMKLIGEGHKLDFALLCIGDNFTMGYQDAATAADWVGAQKIVGMHFDTFGYIQVDHNKVTDYFETKGLSLKLPQIGETFHI